MPCLPHSGHNLCPCGASTAGDSKAVLHPNAYGIWCLQRVRASLGKGFRYLLQLSTPVFLMARGRSQWWLVGQWFGLFKNYRTFRTICFIIEIHSHIWKVCSVSSVCQNLARNSIINIDTGPVLQLSTDSWGT